MADQGRKGNTLGKVIKSLLRPGTRRPGEQIRRTDPDYKSVPDAVYPQPVDNPWHRQNIIVTPKNQVGTATLKPGDTPLEKIPPRWTPEWRLWYTKFYGRDPGEKPTGK